MNSRPSSSSGLISTSVHGNTTRIVYISRRELCIYDGKFNLIQSIDTSRNSDISQIDHSAISQIDTPAGVEGEPNCCQIQAGTDIICVGRGNQLLFYHPSLRRNAAGEMHTFWEFDRIHHYSAEVKAIDWASNGELVVCGTRLLTIYNLKSSSEFITMSEVAAVELPFSTPTKVKYSPCAKFIAVSGQDQSFLMVWYKRNPVTIRPSTTSSSVPNLSSSSPSPQPSYDFLILPHPSPLLNFSWRCADPLRTSLRAVLLTTAVDGTTRLWSTAPAGFGFQTIDLAASIRPETKIPLHWLTSPALTIASAPHPHLKRWRDGLNLPTNTKLLDTLVEFGDLVWGVSAEGTLTIWGVAGVGVGLGRVAKVRVVMRVEGVVKEGGAGWGGEVEMMCIRNPGTFYSHPELTILTHVPATQVLSAYSMNLNDFFTPNWTCPQLFLSHSWCGHRTPIVQMKRHPNLPLLASFDESGELGVFDTGAEGRDELRLRGLLDVPGLRVFEWLPSEQGVLFVADEARVYIYAIGGSATEGFVLLGSLSEGPRMAGKHVSFLRVVKGTIPEAWILVGISEQELLCGVWEINVNASCDHVEQQLVEECSFSCDSLSVHSVNTFDFVGSGVSNVGNTHMSIFANLAIESKTVTTYQFRDGFLDELGGGSGDLFQTVSSFDLSKETGTINKVKANSFGKLAISHIKAEMQFIDIYDNEFSGLEMTFEHQLALGKEDRIVAMDWLTCYDGQHLLALAIATKVIIFCKGHSGWIQVNETLPEFFNDASVVRSVAWQSNGSILVSTTRNTKLFSPCVLTVEGDIPRDIFEITSQFSGRLDDHDPTLLKQYMFWGKYDIVKFNLSLLHRFVKLAIETERSVQHIPIALWKVMAESTVGPPSTSNYNDLFGTTDESALQALGVFAKSQMNFLIENLAKVGMPSSLELTCFIKAFEMFEEHHKSLDHCGLCYFINATYHVALALPAPIPASEYGWAFFSDSQDYLLDVLNRTASVDGKMFWEQARALGYGYWITSPITLRTNFEIIARNQYWGSSGVNDPVSCSLYYIALKKKNVLAGLWKLAAEHPEQPMMLKFLANDFTEERWQKASLKNAFALLGKQRYEYAAAFFLLAGQLKDAANVCIRQLNDPQLAICICRIYEGDQGPVLASLIETTLLPAACVADDRWQSCILWTMLNNREKAFYALARPLESLLVNPLDPDLKMAKNAQPTRTADPGLLLLYNHLKVAYKKLIMKTIPSLGSREEGEFVLECVRSYDRLGCPGLALQLIVTQEMDILPTYEMVEEEPVAIDLVAPTLSLSDPEPVKSSAIDWGELEGGVSKPAEPAGGGIDWGELERNPQSSGLDWGELETKPTTGGLDWGDMASSVPAEGGLDFGDMKSAFADIPDEEPEEEGRAELRIVSDPVKVASTVLVLSAKELARLQVMVTNLSYYKMFLSMRILHELHNSSNVVDEFELELKSDPILSDYYSFLRKGFQLLADVSKVDVDELGILVAARAIETRSLNAFIQILPFDDDVAVFCSAVEQLFLNQANYLCKLAFSSDILAKNEEWHLKIDNLSHNLLLTWASWHEKCCALKIPQAAAVSNLVLATGYLVNILTSTIFKRKNRLWWMLGLCEKFFDYMLQGQFDQLVDLIGELFSDKVPPQHPLEAVQIDESGSGKRIELYDEYGMPQYGAKSKEAAAAEKLVYSLLLSHILSAFELFLERIAEVMNVDRSMDATFWFLSQSLDKSVVTFLYNMQVHVGEDWRKLDMTLEHMPAYILEVEVTELWSLLNRTIESKRSARAIIQTTSFKKSGSSGSLYAPEDDSEQSEKLVRSIMNVSSAEPILAFCVNPLDRSQMAYVTTHAIMEVDTSVAAYYFGTSTRPRDLTADDIPGIPAARVQERAVAPRLSSLGLETINVKRDLSFQSMTALIRRSFHSGRIDDSPSADKGLRLKRPSHTTSTLESHHSLNYYLAGSGDTSSNDVQVSLYQFGQPQELVKYSAVSEGKLTKCHFDPYGAKFAASDTRGDLHIWKFDASPGSSAPCITLRQCHQGAINDFAFLNSSSILATAGMSTSNMNVSIWDTLLPPDRARVKAFPIGEAGISALIFSERHNLLIAGGKQGNIYVMDIRQSLSLVNSFTGHDAMVKSLAINDEDHSLYSGSTRGDVKIWDINALTATDSPPERSFNPWPDSFDQSSSLGIVDLQVIHGQIYSCWGNGMIFRSEVS